MKRRELINKIRKLQTIFSILIFVIIFILCWNVTKFEITEIQLSKWSNFEGIGTIWNASLILLSISMAINQILWVKHNHRLTKKRLLSSLFILVSIFLFFTGIFNISERELHNFFAFSYFFSYPFVLFLAAYLNRMNIQWNQWMHIIIISILMIVLPISFMNIFNGFAISEILHTILVAYWNIWILKEVN